MEEERKNERIEHNGKRERVTDRGVTIPLFTESKSDSYPGLVIYHLYTDAHPIMHNDFLASYSRVASVARTFLGTG